MTQQHPAITDDVTNLSVLTDEEKELYVLCNETFYIKQTDLEKYLKILAKLEINKH